MKEHSYRDEHPRGTIERLVYRTTDRDGASLDKYCLVYLPAGYDERDTEKRYNTLYLVHGGGGSQDAWLDCCKIKNMLDQSINTGEADPLIVIFPSFYKDDNRRTGGPVAEVEKAHVLLFQNELAEELVPAVESRYHTYAKSGTPAALRASREHRAIGGFSMGSCVTWYAFLQHLDLFSRFLPLSGDCWGIEPMGGASHPAETAQLLRSAVLDAGFGPDDLCIFAATGSEDMASKALTPQIEAMKKLPDVFRFEDDFAAGNAHYFVAEGKNHAYEDVYQYVYSYLPYLFAKA